MQITRETDYAVRCVLHLGRNPGSAVPVAGIAAAVRVTPVFLAKILQKLGKAGLVESTRGVQGGFRLARDPAAVSLLDVVEAFQGRVALNRCAGAGERCELSGSCPAHPVWTDLSALVARELAGRSVASLVNPNTEEVPMEKGGRSCPTTPTTTKR